MLDDLHSLPEPKYAEAPAKGTEDSPIRASSAPMLAACARMWGAPDYAAGFSGRAARTGTFIHRVIELWSLGWPEADAIRKADGCVDGTLDTTKVNLQFNRYVNNHHNDRIGVIPKESEFGMLAHTEMRVVEKLGDTYWSGTMDQIRVTPKDGHFYVWDIKTGIIDLPYYLPQLCVYTCLFAARHEHMFGHSPSVSVGGIIAPGDEKMFHFSGLGLDAARQVVYLLNSKAKGELLPSPGLSCGKCYRYPSTEACLRSWRYENDGKEHEG